MVGIQIKRKRNKMSNKTTGQTSTAKRPTLEMLLALAGFIAGVLAKLSFEQVQYLLTNKNTILRKKLVEVFEIAHDEFIAVRAEWEKFYLDHFLLDQTADFSTVAIPEKPTDDSWRLIFIPAGLKMNVTLAVMRAKFKTWSYYDDLDASVTVNTRTSVQSYAIWVRDGIEPDEKHLGQSTRQSDPDGKIGVTLLERMVLETKYFAETGKHLDEVGVTFCTGSRDSDGRVPSMYFSPDSAKVSVDACGVGCVRPALGLREAVSL
jgi:hypothetical protein